MPKTVETWTCHLCGRERPDDKIGVCTYPLKDFPNAEVNVRYCLDNPSCSRAVLIWKNLGMFPKSYTKSVKLELMLQPLGRLTIKFKLNFGLIILYGLIFLLIAILFF